MLQSKDIGWLTGLTNKTHLYAAYKRLPSELKTQTESEGMEKDISCIWKWQESGGSSSLISDKIDFKTKSITKDKEGHYIMIKGSIQEEDITLVNIYAPIQ